MNYHPLLANTSEVDLLTSVRRTNNVGAQVKQNGRVVELADTMDLGSIGASLAGSTPVAPTTPRDTV